MTKAPSVNQMRFLSSSALPKAAQFVLAASCSAADAIESAPSGAVRRVQQGLTLSRQAGNKKFVPPVEPVIWGARSDLPPPAGPSGLGGRLRLEHFDAAAGFLD